MEYIACLIWIVPALVTLGLIVRDIDILLTEK